MSGLPTVKIKDVKKPGDYVIINKSAFVAGRDELFVEGKGSAGKSNGPTVVDGLPEGYALQTIPGGRRKVLVNGETLKHAEGEKVGKDVAFANEAEAIAAAVAHAAAVAQSAE